ncbi:MAG: DNA repair protein [Polyangiaceae bacterium]|jgi:DNA repair protein RadC|nr:DNA repair protein [Polyangiaceae bacterium]
MSNHVSKPHSVKHRVASLRTVPTEELIAALLPNASNATARATDLLARHGGLRSLARLEPHALVLAHGLPKASALRLAAAFELGSRCAEARDPPPPFVRSSADAARLLRPRLARLDHEQLWLLALDARQVPLGVSCLSQGGQAGCAVRARDILRVALALDATCFVLAHNHPSGDLAPSREDIHMTSRVSEAGACVGIALVDHVILTPTHHASLLDLGLMPQTLHDATRSSRGARREFTPQVHELRQIAPGGILP